MNKKTVYCGETIQNKCGKQRHPVKDVEFANKFVNSERDCEVYSNSPDFVSAVKYITKKQNVEVEFFLNGESHGDDIEIIFEDFNRALDMIDKLGVTK